MRRRQILGHLGLTSVKYRSRIAQLEADNRVCNTRVSKLEFLVEGMLVALTSASNCILDHEHNDNNLKSERFYLDSVIEETYRELGNL